MRKIVVMLAALAVLSALAVSTVDAKKNPAPLAPVPASEFTGSPSVGTLAANVVLTQTGWSTGPSIDVPFGDTFEVWGTVTIAGGTATCKLTDGVDDIAISGPDSSISLSGVFNTTDAATLSIDCTGSGIMLASVGTLPGVGAQTAPASTIMLVIPPPGI